MENIIKFDGFSDGKDWIAYKYPTTGFTGGVQLVVNPSQEAVLIQGGEISDIFTSGTHTLAPQDSENKDFVADIFYVNRASRLDLRWGTANPFQIGDPKYKRPVTIRAHGKYGVRIANSGLFIGELVGSAPADTAFSRDFIDKYFKDMLMSYIKTTISTFMITNKISFMEVTPYLVSLSKECNRVVAQEFERYGVEIINLCIETISPMLAEGGASLPPVDMEMPEIPITDLDITVCPACHANVPVGQKFCGECGAAMKKACPACGALWEATQKFCGECGHKL